jgi:hypothetical protein
MIITFQGSHSPLHDRACRTVFVRVVLLIAVTLFPSAALGQKAEESKSENIGPWEIEAIYKADKFDRCSISRTLQDRVASSQRLECGGRRRDDPSASR